MSSGLVGTTTSISILNNKNDRIQYNKGKKKFKMLPIQYNCCKCKGNQLGKQACCILAQQYHIQSYTEKHPEEFKENAKKYKTMNRPKVIKKVCADNLLLTSIDYFLDESEDQLSVYHADYSSEE